MIAKDVLIVKKLKQSEILKQSLQGKKWFQQIDIEDRDTIKDLLDNLYLVSESDFTTGINSLIRDTFESVFTGPIAFYVAREVDPDSHYFDINNGKVQALSSGSDQGSEAIVANIIRQFCRTDPNYFLNHPEIGIAREKKIRRIAIVDDYIGTGQRIYQFLDAIWLSATIKSWFSLGLIEFNVLCYSGTENGMKHIAKHRLSPKVKIVRTSPKITDIPIHKRKINRILDCCKKYGARTCKNHMSFGYKESKGMLVFQHGCPNNAPSMLWAPNHSSKPWDALFPNRSVLTTAEEMFPSLSELPNYIDVLTHIGQGRMLKAGSLSRRGEMGIRILLVLALVSKGVRKIERLSYSTNLSISACQRIVDRCVDWGFLTETCRITPAGRAEINAARNSNKRKLALLNSPNQYYHPTQLRRQR